MYRNYVFIFGLIAALLSGLTACTEEQMFNGLYPIIDSKSENNSYYFWFDSNGIPYRYYGQSSRYGTEELSPETQQRIQDIVIGHSWRSEETYIIEETGQLTSLDSFIELPLGVRTYYIGEDKLLTQYYMPNIPVENPAHKSYTTEKLGMDLEHGDLYKDNIFGLTTYTFRLRILDISESGDEIKLRAVEPLCIVYYDDDIEGQLIFGLTVFTRLNDSETEEVFGDLLQ